MVVVHSRRFRPASAGAGPAAARHREQVGGANGSKPAYKVVVEETLRPKKTLIVSTYSNREPPSGYTFVPAGDPQLTAQCKEFARQDGARVYVVSTTKHQDTQLSMEVHRIGYHFPSSIVERACTKLGTTIYNSASVIRGPAPGSVERPRNNHHKKGLGRIEKKALKNMQQKEVDREARQAILDLFPAIPNQDLDVVIDRAFDLGSKNVGTQVKDLSLPRRVQLAVVAHIRHVYTDYDNVLKQVPWLKARSMVEEACLEKLAQWRGGEEDDPDAMEEILQEVIVIPDDEDAGAETHEAPDLIVIDPPSQTQGPRWTAEGAPNPMDRTQHSFAGTSSRTSPSHQDPQMAHRRNWPDAPNPQNSTWTDRARIHQEQAWKQAQIRVRNTQFQDDLPMADRGSDQFRYEPLQDTVERRMQPLQAAQKSPIRSPGYWQGKRSSDSQSHRFTNFAPEIAPVPLGTGTSHNLLQADQIQHPRIENLDKRSRNNMYHERIVPRGTPVAYFPEDVVMPSVEPSTPRRGRFTDITDTPPTVNTMPVEYPSRNRERPVRTYRHVEDAPESFDFDQHVYRPTQERNLYLIRDSASPREAPPRVHRAVNPLQEREPLIEYDRRRASDQYPRPEVFSDPRRALPQHPGFLDIPPERRHIPTNVSTARVDHLGRRDYLDDRGGPSQGSSYLGTSQYPIAIADSRETASVALEPRRDLARTTYVPSHEPAWPGPSGQVPRPYLETQPTRYEYPSAPVSLGYVRGADGRMFEKRVYRRTPPYA